MDLVKKEVKHKTFGDGIVISQDDSYIEIEFSIGSKKFVFPDAFKKFLQINDKKASIAISKIIEKKEKERKAELEIKRKKALEQERQQKILRLEKSMTTIKNHPSLQVVFWCKEQEWDEIFRDWRVFTGLIKSGANKGKPNRLARMNKKSACLLTAREPHLKEEDRYIKGVYLVEDNFNGRLCEDGYIPAHQEYRLCLSEEESKKMYFWNYYANKKYPNRTTWNTGRSRYFDNIIMAQILRDIISLKKEPKDKEYVNRFFEYFCQINQINKDTLEKPNGALVRI